MRRFLFIAFSFCLFLTSLNGRGNNQSPLDTLESKLRYAPTDERASILVEIGNTLRYSSPDKAILTYSEAIGSARSLDDPELLIKCMYALSYFYWEQGRFEQSLELDMEILSMYRELNDSIGRAKTEMGIAAIYSGMGLNEMALEMQLEALKTFESYQQDSLRADCLLNIGVAYSNMNQFDLATDYFNDALDVAEQIDYEELLPDIYINLASQMDASKSDCEEALKLYSEAENLLKFKENQSWVPLVKGNIALSYLCVGKPETALKSAQKGWEVAIKMDNQVDLAYLYATLGDIYSEMQEYETAITYYDSCNYLCDANDYMSQKSFSLYYQSYAYAGIGDFEKAFELHARSYEIEDSLFEFNNATRAEYLISAHKLQSQNQALEDLSKKMILQEEKSAFQHSLLIVTIVAVLLLIGLILFGIRVHRRQKRTNAQLKAINKKLQEQKEMAEAGQKAKSTFLSVMSHELRTPLNVVTGTTNLMLLQEHSPEQKENLNVLQLASKSLISLINNVLDFSKLESGKLELDFHPTQVRGMVNDIAVTHKNAARQKGIELLVKIDPTVPNTILTDPQRLSQILTNLVNNAIKFTHEGFVKISVCRNESNGSEDSLRFLVEDSGIGIPEDHAKHIFNVFTQAEQSTSRKYGGSGLGLSICKNLLELLGSDIHMESEPDKGSVFWFDLNCNIVASGNKDEPILRPQNALISAYKDQQILVVDDNELNLLVIDKLFKQWGLEIDMTLSGKHAIQMCEEKPYKFILMDINMPEMDGVEATRQIRSINHSCKIFALSAGRADDIQQQEAQSLFDGYLKKPLEIESLLEELQRAILTNEES